MAGIMPNAMPVSALATSAATIARGGMLAWIGSVARTSAVSPPPMMSPTTAPMPVSVAASTRNCQRMMRRVAPSA